MINDLNKKLVDAFNFEYNEDKFKLFINDLLGSADFKTENQYKNIPNDYTDFIKSYKRICKYEYMDPEYSSPKVIDVLVVKLKKASSIERARTAQRNFVARYLNGSHDGYQKDAALVAFISETDSGNISPDWRFSFIQMNYVTKLIETDDGKKKLKTEIELTPAKRFSFLVGKNENSHTAQKQFYNCLEKSSRGEQITIEDLIQAFDIEKVSEEFFDKYKTLYIKLRDELKRLCKEDKIVNKDFTEHNINVDDFAKKTLGQLVFLYFIQKKGWLGVKKDKDWGTGDKKFLRNVFEGKYGEYDNFFNDILEHLFYEALAYDRGYNNFEFEKLNCRIPFLNGGLFEPVNGYEWTKTNLTIDNSIFKEIFDTFDLYNFTVKEDEPLEKEVAIDPEMLGKVFEKLIEENERKGKGAFYTPREIVHYMCQESLINYLYNKINIKEVPLTEEEKNQQLSLLKTKKEREQLKLTHEVIEEIISKEDIEFLIRIGNSTYINKQRGINVVLPESVGQNARLLDNALSDIKVCDPAIGSGAFPVGMMNEIVRARAALSKFIQPDRSFYQLKLNAIENSIYGVDIDPGAVDIAKLRFWLSLVVDEEDIKNIKPLPNLDYKIMQGNSLITSYGGIDFDEIVDKQVKEKQLGLFSSTSEKITDRISYKQKEFLNTPYPTKKAELKQEIEDLIVELVKAKFKEKANAEGHSKDFQEEQIRNFAQNKGKRIFFPWKLFFANVFEEGGFDIVIGNPPYIGQKGHKELFEKMKSNPNFEDKMDYWYFFLHKAFDILKVSGITAYITPSYWTTANGAKKVRRKFAKQYNVIELINFNDNKVFTAGVHTNLFILSKINNSNNYCKYCIYEDIYENDLICNMAKEKIHYIKQSTILNSWTNFISFLPENIYKIIDKLTYNSEKLCDPETERKATKGIIAGKKLTDGICNVYPGIETGKDRLKNTISNVDEGVFILSENEVRNLNLDEYEQKKLKKFYKNSDINKYYINESKYYIIYINDIENEQDFKQYSHLYSHFEKYKNILLSRAENGVLKSANKRGKWWALKTNRPNGNFDNANIVCPQRSRQNLFGYSDGGTLACSDVFFISSNTEHYSLKYILCLLNSSVIYFWLYWMGKRKGKLLELCEEPLQYIPIKKADKVVQERFVVIVDKILEITKKDYSLQKQENQNAVLEYEKQIDLMVYKLYDLTYQEVLTIDPDFAIAEKEYNQYKI